jgi:hypothetical protein
VRGAETRNAAQDRQAITDLIYRYCRSMDRRDQELGYSIFHHDAAVDYGLEVYSGSGHGFIDWVTTEHLKFLNHSHQVTNVIIELNGDSASSEAYVTVALRLRNGAQLKQITAWCRYLDRWSCREGSWGIDERVTVTDLDEIRNIEPLSGSYGGARDRSDPSYVFLGGTAP